MGYEGSAVQRWYESAPLNVAVMTEVLHPEVEFRVCPGWPNGGVFHGRDSVMRDFFPAASHAWESIRPEVDEVLELGDRYVIRGRYIGVASPTGTAFTIDFVHIWRVAGDQLVQLHQIADTAILADARRA